MGQDSQSRERVVLNNVFTVASEWALITRVVGQVREAVRRRRRDHFFFLDASVEEKLTEAGTCCDVTRPLPEEPALLFTPLQALFWDSLDEITAGCPPGALDKRLAQARKAQLKHHTIGSRTLASERAPTLSSTMRIQWFPDPKRPKNKHSWLLLDFRQYAPVSEDDLRQGLEIPPFVDPPREAYLSWEAWQDAVRTAMQAWNAVYGEAVRKAQEAQHRLWTPLKTCTIAVWHDHALVPKMLFRTKKFRDASRNVRKCRLAAGDDTQHWKWLYAHPHLADDDMTVLVLLYLLQERMLALTPENFLFLQRYFHRFRGATQVGEGDLFEHMLQNFVLPEDWRTMWTYIKKVLSKKVLSKQGQQASEAGREQSVGPLLDQVEASQVKKRQGYPAKSQRPSFASSHEHSPQAYAVDAVVSLLQAEVTEHAWAPSRATVYNWIEKGHRWYGKIDVIRSIRDQLRITEQGLAQVRMITQAENRCDKLRNSPGMTDDNRKKLYQRYRKPDRTPDLDAIEAHVARCSRTAEADVSAQACPSLKDRCTVLKKYIEELADRQDVARTPAEWDTIQEERERAHERLRQLQEGS